MSRRQALHRLKIAECAADRLCTIRLGLEREANKVDRLNGNGHGAELRACAVRVAMAEQDCERISKECEAVIVGAKAVPK